MPTHPTDRELLVALIDAVMTLSNRLFPDEYMNIRVRIDHPNCKELNWMVPSMTHWVPKQALAEKLALLE